MKKSSYRYLVFLAITILFAISLHATTYYVSTSGSNANSGISPQFPLKTVDAAVDIIKSGDTIVISPGNYQTSVFVSELNEITISGDESGKLTNASAGRVVLKPTKVSDSAIKFYRVKDATISGITFEGPGEGIALERSPNINVTRCTFNNLARGIALNSSANVTLSSSVITQCVLGVFSKNSANFTFIHNTLANATSSGIILLTSPNAVIAESIFISNNTNYVTDDVTADTSTSDNNVLSGITGPFGAVPTVANPYEWSAASNQDFGSTYVVPSFVNPKAFDLRVSPEISWPGGQPGVNLCHCGKKLLDRDGNEFVAGIGAYNYASPTVQNGWKAYEVKFEGSIGKRMSAGVYKADGTLIRLLVQDIPVVNTLYWDGRDDLGRKVEAGEYEIRAISSSIRMLDDGAVGDNGSPKGMFNCDNADVLIPVSDGTIIMLASYDEAGFTLRRLAKNGQPIFASAFTDGDFFGGQEYKNMIIAGRGQDNNGEIVLISLPGERGYLSNGELSYPIFNQEEVGAGKGVAVINDVIYVSISNLDVIRKIDLYNGNHLGDIEVPSVGTVSADKQGNLWAISGTDVVKIVDGNIATRFATQLQYPYGLSVKEGRIAVGDRANSKLNILNSANGQVIAALGKERTEYFTSVSLDLYRDIRGIAYLDDGRLAITEQSRFRIFDPENLAAPAVEMVSNFMESAVTHPTDKSYVYCGLGIYKVNEKNNEWRWIVEAPVFFSVMPNQEDYAWHKKHIGSPGQSVVISGKPYLAYYNHNGSGTLQLWDVTDPVNPKLSFMREGMIGGWAYDTIDFNSDGDILYASGYKFPQEITLIPFTGLDNNGNPTYGERTNLVATDEDQLRSLKSISAVTSDKKVGDLYYLAVTDQFNQMVPAWGADGTGVGKTDVNVKTKWFSRSSGGNYMSISNINIGGNAYVMAGKSFGGQVDLFNEDGLRITTGNWSYPSNYTIGFVDLRFGVHAYERADGKPGAYIEDDGVGRFARYRVDNIETLAKVKIPISWDGNGVEQDGTLPLVERGTGLVPDKKMDIKRVEELPIAGGDWSKWEEAGVSTQILGLPCNVGFKRTMADNLMQSFDEGVVIAAIAADKENFYVYFLAVDQTPQFFITDPGSMWRTDSIELWVEEEQFGLGILADGSPSIFKYRYHNLEGVEWAAGYGLPNENVWGTALTDVGTHPLGKRLETIIGTSLSGKSGFVVCGKIPFKEVFLVGGLPDVEGRQGKALLPTTGEAGEIVRISTSLNNVSMLGRTQDYMIDWPAGKMFSDPTRSFPFVFTD